MTPSFGHVWNATCVVLGARIFHGEGLSVANAKEVQNYTAATTTHVAFQQHSRTTNAHRDQRVTVVGQQRELGLVDHLDHGRGEPLLGGEEVWIHVLDVDQKMLPRGQMETTPSVFAVRCDLVRVALDSVVFFRRGDRPIEMDRAARQGAAPLKRLRRVHGGRDLLPPDDRGRGQEEAGLVQMARGGADRRLTMRSHETQEHEAVHGPDGESEGGDHHERDDEELGRDLDQVRPIQHYRPREAWVASVRIGVGVGVGVGAGRRVGPDGLRGVGCFGSGAIPPADAAWAGARLGRVVIMGGGRHHISPGC